MSPKSEKEGPLGLEEHEEAIFSKGDENKGDEGLGKKGFVLNEPIVKRNEGVCGVNLLVWVYGAREGEG